VGTGGTPYCSPVLNRQPVVHFVQTLHSINEMTDIRGVSDINQKTSAKPAISLPAFLCPSA
jgi:hypothetical protein